MPGVVDRIQCELGAGPCLDGIRGQDGFSRRPRAGEGWFRFAARRPPPAAFDLTTALVGSTFARSPGHHILMARRALIQDEPRRYDLAGTTWRGRRGGQLRAASQRSNGNQRELAAVVATERASTAHRRTSPH